jgi:hypothetical protein
VESNGSLIDDWREKKRKTNKYYLFHLFSLF